MRRFVFFLLVCLQFAVAQQSVTTDSLFSPNLGRSKQYSILLPKEYSKANRYPVLFLLHGFSGNHTNWWKLTKLQEYCASLNLIVVMPDAENSWYANALADEHRRFQDYLKDDLYSDVRAKYSIDTTQQAIGGLSMGGYGALLLALKQPERYVICAPLSGSFDIPRNIPKLEEFGRGAMRKELEAAFGASPSQQWDENDPWLLILQKQSRLPYFYLANGIQDEFKQRLGLYRAFADTLRAREIPYEYHEEPGRHGWNYWDKEVKQLLLRMKQMMNI